MQINGFNKTTLLDYPGHVACTVFTGGCNFCCPFCQNGDLVLHAGQLPQIPEEEIFQVLRKRQGILTGICVTGGEPTLQPDLDIFLSRVKELGYLVKLDSNGYRPEVLESLCGRKLVDYIAMDIKSSPENYTKTIGLPALDMGRIRASVDFIRSCGLPYEFRTTVALSNNQNCPVPQASVCLQRLQIQTSPRPSFPCHNRLPALRDKISPLLPH